MDCNHSEPINSDCSITLLSDDLLWIIFDLIYHTTPGTVKLLAQVSQQTRHVALQMQYREVVLTPMHLGPVIAPEAPEVSPSGRPIHRKATVNPTSGSDSDILERNERKTTWNRHYGFIFKGIHETTRQITINTALDWDQAAEFLTLCKNLQRIAWASTYNLTGPIPQPILHVIATKSPSIEVHLSGRHWQNGWPFGQDVLPSILPHGCLKSLEYFCILRNNLLCSGDFSGLKFLHIDRCDTHQLISSLPPNPFPSLQTFKISLWNIPDIAVAKQELSQLLEMVCPLEHLDITCPGRYLGFTMPVKHSGLRILKLRNNSSRNFFMNDASEHRSFWRSGIQNISATCPQISELTLDMFPKSNRMNRCIRRLSTFSNLRLLVLRIQTQLIPSEPTIFPNHDVDLNYVDNLVDEIVSLTTSEKLALISVEAGDFKRRRESDQRALWQKMLAEGYDRRRKFEYVRVEPGLFAIRTPK